MFIVRNLKYLLVLLLIFVRVNFIVSHELFYFIFEWSIYSRAKCFLNYQNSVVRNKEHATKFSGKVRNLNE